MHSHLALIATLGLSALLLAGCTMPPSPAEVQQLIRRSSGNDAFVVERVFPDATGLYGVVFKVGATGHGFVWVTPNGNAVIPGPVIDANQQDLTKYAEVQQGLRASPIHLWRYAAAPAARSVTLGARGPLLTAFVDPNCPFCHLLYENLQPGIAKGQLRVRYVLVGIIRPNSAARAASLLAAPDLARAIAQNEAGFDVPAEQGAFPIAPASTYTRFMSTIDANNDALQRAGSGSTPTLVYCDKATRQMVLRPGSVPLADLLQDMAAPSACGMPS